MKLTNKSAYGVRALIDLAVLHNEKYPVSIKWVAKKEGISKIFLEQIFSCLKKKDILKSIRGPKGGYTLTKSPAEISVYEIVKVLEGNITPAKCETTTGEKRVCERAYKCASKGVWDEVEEQIRKTLQRYSLEELAVRAKKIDKNWSRGE